MSSAGCSSAAGAGWPSSACCSCAPASAPLPFECADCSKKGALNAVVRWTSGTLSRWKPVAITVIFTWSPISSSITTPKLICTSSF